MAEIDIEVKQGILATYHNYTYKPPQVFAEFIDNAIQSYEDNRNSLLDMYPDYKLRVDITIEWEEDAAHVWRACRVTVEDNAAGMTSEKFADAFKSADMNQIRGGMNEFGMGMKVAACWLGKKWRVESKSITEDVTHTLDVNVEDVSKHNIKQLTSKDTIEESRGHGTTIIIENMWPQIKKEKLNELKDGIASIYRYFLRRNEIQIFINGQLLSFENYEVLKAPAYNNPMGPDIIWKKNIDVDLDGTGRYKATGFIALLKEMDDQQRGVVFLRRNRVVMGFDPSERSIGKRVMGQPGSFKYRRVFGELEISGFEVAFGKNQIIDIDQLEVLMQAVAGKAVIDGVNILTQGDRYRKRPKPSSPPQHSTPPSAPSSTPPAVSSPSVSTPPSTPPIPSTTSSNRPTALPAATTFQFGGNAWQFEMIETTDTDELFANDLSRKDDKVLVCRVNLNHPFFKAYGAPQKQTLALIRAFSIAIFKARTDGKGNVTKMMSEFDEIINDLKVD